MTLPCVYIPGPFILQPNVDCLSAGFRCVNVNGASHTVPLKLCASGAKIPEQGIIDLF